MATSPITSTTAPPARDSLRLQLSEIPPPGSPDGAWWPRSRDLQTEAADLLDHFPTSAGRIDRLLFSRPDWDEPTTAGRRLRKVLADRGPVKIGSFPSDDTRLMVLTMASGRRMRLLVIPSDSGRAEGERLLASAGRDGTTGEDGADWARWDDESPHS